MVMLAMFGALTYNMVTMTMKVLSHPVEVQFKMSSNSQLTFPAVTVCNLSPIKKSSLTAVVTNSNSVVKRRRKRAVTAGEILLLCAVNVASVLYVNGMIDG